MFRKLIAILVIAISMTLLSAEKYAVLIAGDYNATNVPSTALWNNGEGDNSEFWNDLFLQWEMLTQKKGYKPENVTVLFANGTDHWLINDLIDTRYRATKYPGFNTITNYAATEANVATVCADLNSKMVYGDDFLYVWTMSHSNAINIYLMNDDLTSNVSVSYTDFANYFKPLNALNKVYHLSMNCATNLEQYLQEDNAVIISSSRNVPGNDKSYRADNKIFGSDKGPTDPVVVENEVISAETYFHGEVNFHLYSVMNGARPDGEEYYYSINDVEYDHFTDADTNFDSEISIFEAYLWMKPLYEDTRISIATQVPQLYQITGVSGIERGNFISLKYPTILSNHEKSGYYCCGPDYPICGIIGISDDVSAFILPEIEQFSEVTFFDTGIENPLVEGDITFNDCDVNGETDYFPINLIGNMTLVGARLRNLQLNISSLGALIPKVGTLSDCEVNIEDQSNLVFPENSRLTLNNTTINGNVNLPANSTIYVGINSEFRIGEGSHFIAESNSTISLKPGAKLIIEKDAICDLTGSMSMVMGAFADIIVEEGGTLNGLGGVEIKPNISIAELDKGSNWNGITAEIGSNINLNYVNISDALTSVSGSAANVNISNSSFTDCENGVSLINCDNYTLNNNNFYGKGIGSGISLTYCSNPIIDNFVSNFGIGVKLVSSTLTLAKNTITNNINNGLFITGNGSKPTLVDVVSKDLTQKSTNNDIIDNGLNSLFYARSQIYMRYSAGIYMTNGYNNVYSGANGTLPAVPCIKGIFQPVIGEPYINKVVISAEMNYWGYPTILDENWGYFFSFDYNPFGDDTGYSIDFDPYGLEPFTEEGPYPATNLSSNEPPSRESTLLFNAMRLEQDDKYTPSIKLYEKVIDDYPNSEEYYVAMARLPYVYEEAAEPLDRLINTYDEAILSEEITNKKFFKEMKVSTKIKDKKYDEAIMLAEKMKAEATTDEEKALSDIDIAIANMMKNAESKGKSTYDSSTINDLLAKLTGDEGTGEKTDIVESALPSEFALYQNYPNPFNPTTEISYALSQDANVSIKVYSSNGSVVADLVNASQSVGNHSVTFDASKLSNGIFYYSLVANGRIVSTKKMLLLK